MHAETVSTMRPRVSVGEVLGRLRAAVAACYGLRGHVSGVYVESVGCSAWLIVILAWSVCGVRVGVRGAGAERHGA